MYSILPMGHRERIYFYTVFPEALFSFNLWSFIEDNMIILSSLAPAAASNYRAYPFCEIKRLPLDVGDAICLFGIPICLLSPLMEEYKVVWNSIIFNQMQSDRCWLPSNRLLKSRPTQTKQPTSRTFLAPRCVWHIPAFPSAARQPKGGLCLNWAPCGPLPKAGELLGLRRVIQSVLL